MKSLLETLMERDEISEEEAQALIDEARAELQRRIADGRTEDAYEICQDMFGLEPDYLHELL